MCIRDSLVAVWVRIKGVCEHFHPQSDAGFVDRIAFGRIVLKHGEREQLCHSLAEAVGGGLSARTGRGAGRGGQGDGESTVAAAPKNDARGKG